MRTLQLQVRASLPARLQPLWDLARNVWWSWSPEAIALFRRIDPEAYEACGACPLKLLNTLPPKTWDELVKDDSFLEHLDSVMKRFSAYLTAVPSKSCAFGNRREALVAYFSMEFGLHESIPLYSGGLGVLAGDHLKTASDLGLPVVAVGLFYREGYFRQVLNRSGWQTEHYEVNDPFFLPMELVTDKNGQPFELSLTISGREVYFQVWRLNVGKVSLLLLDTHVPSNGSEMRRLTARLYAPGQDIRIQQEMVLGIGGVKALAALGLKPSVFHLNEGHSAFLTLERIAQATRRGLSWKEALFVSKGSQVFTVHTPVPAGNDSFAMDKLHRYLGNIYELYSIPDDEFFNLGRFPERPDEFSMPVFALRTSTGRNGVSKLHKQVSQRIWKPLWMELQENEVPIKGITNGVHTRTWICKEIAGLLDQYIGKGWEMRTADDKNWSRVESIPDAELWNLHLLRKAHLISYILRSVELSKRNHHAELRDTLRPEVLTIGFARRFTGYKRGNLLFRNIQRLKKIVTNEDRPVQIFIAGKAHPQDHHGKEIIHSVISTIEREKLGDRIVFLEDYDMNVGRMLVRGVDVWLNTPIRPLEASGTSGMKASMNGVLQLSVLDGWWDEAYDPAVGWAIGDRDEYPDEHTRDEMEAEHLYDVLEQIITPMYYGAGVPTEWIRKMKAAIASYAPEFGAHRMLLDYVRDAYKPAQEFYEAWDPDNPETSYRLRSQLDQERQLRERWNDVKVLKLDLSTSSVVHVGDNVNVEIEVASPFPNDWLEVLLVPACSAIHQVLETQDNDEIIRCNPAGRSAQEAQTYTARLHTDSPGVRSYTVRVTPNPAVFPNSLDLNLVVRWH